MIVRIDRSFDKDGKKIKSKVIKSRLAKIIIEIKASNKLSDIPNLKKIQGTRIYYRIKIGDYRIGLIISKGAVQLIRFLHRKEVYRYFP